MFALIQNSRESIYSIKEKTIILEEDIVSLDEVNIMNPKRYVELAFKNLKAYPGHIIVKPFCSIKKQRDLL